VGVGVTVTVRVVVEVGVRVLGGMLGMTDRGAVSKKVMSLSLLTT
jgi:hypothetical protein